MYMFTSFSMGMFLGTFLGVWIGGHTGSDTTIPYSDIAQIAVSPEDSIEMELEEVPLDSPFLDNLISEDLLLEGATLPVSDQKASKEEARTFLQNQNQVLAQKRVTLNQTGIPESRSSRYNLIELDLKGRRLGYLPDEIGDLIQVERLSLRNNLLQQLNPRLEYCQRLKYLDLSENLLAAFPVEVLQLRNLERLNLMDNNLSALPEGLKHLRKLERLDISNAHAAMARGRNRFTSVPKVICQLPNLEKLFLEKLDISRLPYEIKQLRNLQLLSLKGNRYLDLDHTFELLSKMPNLVILDISFIGKTRMPESIGKLKHLKVLMWNEESGMNHRDIARLKRLLPNTKIYYGGPKERMPFLRHNSIKTILKG